MIIDLHSHTTASDGEFKPKELIDKAIQKKISVLAITDHDTIDSLAMKSILITSLKAPLLAMVGLSSLDNDDDVF